MKENMIKNKIFNISFFLSVIMLFLTLDACKKAENYYEKLHAQPEVRTDYQPVYGVGDTLKLTGRLNPANGLKIQIGGVEAGVAFWTKIAVNREQIVTDTLDVAHIVIKNEMGIGANRKIEVTSGGNTIQCPPIEIVDGADNGFLDAKLKLVKHAEMPVGAVFLHCQNGKGTIYAYKLNRTLIRIDKSGANSIVMSGNSLSDQYGTFSINTFNAGGVDPQERYLYFSAVTTDGNADNADNTVYRFCRYDLQQQTLTTLNRSAYPNEFSKRVLAAYTPFEGNVLSTKLFALSGIYPDRKGNVFVRISSASTIAKLGEDGNLKYLVRVGATVPDIYDASAGGNMAGSEVERILPGVVISNSFLSGIRSILPDESLLYINVGAYADNIRQVDLKNSVELYGFTPKYIRAISGGEIPFISGSFGMLTGGYETSNPPGLFGYMPLPDAKVLILYYQGLDSKIYPALATLNFREKMGRRYAPGKLLLNGYTLNSADKMLNYDEEGMIYMTANNKQALIKTNKQ